MVTILAEFGHSDATAAGYLHDVIEDTAVDREQIASVFGDDVAAAVAFCSDEPGPTRKDRKRATYARMAADVRTHSPWIAMAVRAKVADRLANVRSSSADNPRLLATYKAEMQTFREALYMPGVCDSMWSALADLLAE